MSRLFKPFNAGAASLGHRVVMAPLTRMRSDPGDSTQRLDARDIHPACVRGWPDRSPEATPISRQGYGYAGAPGSTTTRRSRAGAPLQTRCTHVGARSSCSFGMSAASRIRTSSRTVNDQIAPSGDFKPEGYGYSENGEVAFVDASRIGAERDSRRRHRIRRGRGAGQGGGLPTVWRFTAPTAICPDQFLQDGTDKRTDDYGGGICHDLLQFGIEENHQTREKSDQQSSNSRTDAAYENQFLSGGGRRLRR